ncbi:MAG: DUF1553 domain-containing protein, partial [Planctomycetaceae bacterium]|nr:DUF1553 domain-containing protein [Planctomycetaceae bacterium]
QALEPSGLSADLSLSTHSTDAERRRQLAMWLTAPQNPLTARVLVNRIWHYHFGRGIVDTPSDFGFSGGRPSHPELLDYLTRDFIDHGWDIKRLHRQILLSATYQQSSQVASPHAEDVDADNRLLWRSSPRQLEGEAVRDAILAVSGMLNPQIGGPSFRDVKINLATNHEFTEPTNELTQETCRRTIYRLWARSGNLPMLQSLDCPDPSVMVPLRPGTITPLQAMSMLNSDLTQKCSKQMAERLRRECPDDSEGQLRRAWLLALGRDITEKELEPARQLSRSAGLDAVCVVLFNSNEFLFVN